MSKSRSATAIGRSRGGLGGRTRGGHIEVIPFRPHRAWWVQALLLLWRWMFEVLFLIALVWLIHKIGDRTGLSWQRSTLVLLAAMVLPFLIPPARRVLVAVFWVGVCRHRLRAFFIECHIVNRSGKLPWIVAAKPIPVGERIWLWLVPGLSVEDFENRAEDIAAACWATTARIERHRRYAFLVRLDVVRRDPLTRSGALPSILVPARRAGANTGAGTTVVSTGVPVQAEPLDLPRQVVGLIDASVKNTSDSGSGGTVKNRKPAQRNSAGQGKGEGTGSPAPSASSESRAVTRGGEDVSDYV